MNRVLGKSDLLSNRRERREDAEFAKILLCALRASSANFAVILEVGSKEGVLKIHHFRLLDFPRALRMKRRRTRDDYP